MTHLALRRVSRQLIFVLILSLTAPIFAARDFGGRYTAERLANARANCEKYDWAKKIRDSAVKSAAPWLARSDDELWSMIPGQDLPRTIDVTLDRNIKTGPKRLGCLVCGDKIDAFGNYPYEPDFEKLPWKLTCPSCKTVFPTNDFGKYYASGIDETGLFNPKKADRTLLFNAEHPDPKAPLHLYGVDDGFGYIDENGRGHRFIAYYTWKYWRHLFDGIKSLADAYVYTGDNQYAHKAAIMLDRLADVYPSMQWKPYADRGYYHSDGNSDRGKIEGRIWETGQISGVIEAYDKILSGTRDDAALCAFLSGKSEQFKLPTQKGTRDLLVGNIETGLIREAAKGVLVGQIEGNEGMQQRTMATCAVALDTEPETSQWMDWVFAPNGGALPGLMIGNLDRDGISPEGAPGYALLWGSAFDEIATAIDDYGKYKKYNLYRDFPQFRAYEFAGYRLCALGIATPNVGDTGSTGSIGRVNVSPERMADAYRHTRDERLAVVTYRANGNSGAGLGRDIFAKDPDTVSDAIDRLGKAAGPRPLGSTLISGYGLGILESPAGGGTALTCYAGRTIHHAHQDLLNFDILAFGKWLAPDMGYPEFATDWPHRSAVTVNTLAHNTVVVDKTPQVSVYGGKTALFKAVPGLTVYRASAPAGYKQAKTYDRTMMLIDAPGGHAYVVDIFHVVGGKDHVYSFHGPPGAVKATGVELAKQDGGSYAGPDVPPTSTMKPLGYSYWYNVERASQPGKSFMLDWTAEPGYRGTSEDEDTHLRMYSLSPCDDLALADANPPQNKPGNPRRLRYALLHRSGNDGLDSNFVSVFEPYRKTPFIKSVETLETQTKATAIRVTLVDGIVDRIVFNPDGGMQKVADGIGLTGTLALIREAKGKPAQATLIDASDLKYKDLVLTARPSLAGKVAKINKELDGGGYVWIDQPIPDGVSLAGEEILIANDNERDATYRIESAEKDGALTKLYCGPISFVRGYAGPTLQLRGHSMPAEYSRGYLHDFKEGDAFHIALHAVSETR